MGLFTPWVTLRPTPFLRWTPGEGRQSPSEFASPSKSTPISASQTWAPVHTVANQDELHELVNKIRLLQSSSEDRPLILEVCDRASTEATAREAIRALMHEFKKAQCPDAQLSAARLWAILLRNSSDAFVSQSAAVDFLETIEALIVSNATSPVVRNRLLHVLGDAVHNHPTNKGFRRLWIAVKPVDAPDQGFPYDAHDAILRSSGNRYRQNPAVILDRINPPACSSESSSLYVDDEMQVPQSQGIDSRFPYGRETPPPSYETATTRAATDSGRHSPDLSSASEILSMQDSKMDSVPGSPASIPVAPPRRLQTTSRSDRRSAQRMAPTRDSPFSTNVPTVSTARPTALRRTPLTQASNRVNTSSSSSSSVQRRTAMQTTYTIGQRCTQPIYRCTLRYLESVASAHDYSGTWRILVGFSQQMDKLSSVDSLIYAMQYRDTLKQVEFSDSGSGWPSKAQGCSR
ncbi:Kinase-like protein [Mycena venus]|uniref:Kinase-like protein n=1 Tax=Mycena venus TaxID=2733690 RepID=A0A8H6XKX1_9AGAR|nr:Kinase-like protein [Mycena venus]